MTTPYDYEALWLKAKLFLNPASRRNTRLPRSPLRDGPRNPRRTDRRTTHSQGPRHLPAEDRVARA